MITIQVVKGVAFGVVLTVPRDIRPVVKGRWVMDPDTAREALMVQARRVIAGKPHDVDAMAEAAMALDEWLLAGGFLPSAWDHNRHEVCAAEAGCVTSGSTLA
jgi:hypothetical protein